MHSPSRHETPTRAESRSRLLSESREKLRLLRPSTPFDGFSYYGASGYIDPPYDYWDCVTNVLVTPPGFARHDLGATSEFVSTIDPAWGFEGARMYGYSYGDMTTKPCIHLQGGIHGSHEWGTVHLVQEFANMLGNPSSYAQEDVINELKGVFDFFIIPSVNPWGYHRRYHRTTAPSDAPSAYGNANGVDANYNFGNQEMWNNYGDGSAPFSEPESQIIRDVVEAYEPLALFDIHAHVAPGMRTLNESNVNPNDTPMLQNNVDSYLAAANPKGVENRAVRTIFPTAPQWANTLTNKHSRSIIGIDVETTYEYTDIYTSRLFTNYIFIVCYNLMVWFQDGRLFS